MDKLRLDYFLSKLKLSEGDVVGRKIGLAIVAKHNIDNFNAPHSSDVSIWIESLASRKNTGEQPCGDDVPVALKEGGCHPGLGNAFPRVLLQRAKGEKRSPGDDQTSSGEASARGRPDRHAAAVLLRGNKKFPVSAPSGGARPELEPGQEKPRLPQPTRLCSHPGVQGLRASGPVP